MNDNSKIDPEEAEKHPDFSKDTIKAQEIPVGEERKWKETEIQDQVLLLRPTGEQMNI
jgi:hypothetical protein